MSRFVELYSYITHDVSDNQFFVPAHSAMVQLVSVLMMMKIMATTVMISTVRFNEQIVCLYR
jgi:hypothetical protein